MPFAHSQHAEHAEKSQKPQHTSVHRSSPYVIQSLIACLPNGTRISCGRQRAIAQSYLSRPTPVVGCMRVLDNDRSNLQKHHAPLNLHTILQLLLPHILRPLTLFPRDSLPNEHSSSGHGHQNHLLGQAIKTAESCARRKRATLSSDAAGQDTLPRSSPPFYGPVDCLTSAHQPRQAPAHRFKVYTQVGGAERAGERFNLLLMAPALGRRAASAACAC